MVDSITEEILNASLAGVVKQMQEALFRTGFSTIIRESHDASCAVLTLKGDVAAQHIVLPLHLGVFPVSIRAVLKSYSADNIRDGDAFLVTLALSMRLGKERPGFCVDRSPWSAALGIQCACTAVQKSGQVSAWVSHLESHGAGVQRLLVP